MTTTSKHSGQHLKLSASLTRQEWRREAEEVILGACLFSKYAYASVMDVLQPRNFKNYCFYMELAPGKPMPNGHIWAAIGTTYMNGVVDLITVSHTMVVAYGHLPTFSAHDCSYGLSKLTDRIASIAHIRYHALLMMEMDIRENALELLRNMADEDERFIEFTELTTRVADERNDLFATIETCVSYLRSYGYTDEAELMDELVGKVSKRLQGIKQQNYRNHIIAQYNLLTNPTNE